jgi:hypothetical protein
VYAFKYILFLHPFLRIIQPSTEKQTRGAP